MPEEADGSTVLSAAVCFPCSFTGGAAAGGFLLGGVYTAASL